MIDYNKYNCDKDDIEFLNTLSQAVSTGTEFFLCYKDFDFLLEPCSGCFDIWHNEKKLASFKTFDDLLLNFKFGDKSFIECVSDIDYK